MLPTRALSPADNRLLLHHRSNNLESSFYPFDMKSSPGVDMIDSDAPTSGIGHIVQADFFPESENEYLIVGSQRCSSSDLRGAA